jgi:hypothetical protein
MNLNLEFWCLMPLSAISWQSVLLVEETGGAEKTTNLSKFVMEKTNIKYMFLTFLVKDTHSIQKN